MPDRVKYSFTIPCYRSESTVMIVVDEIEATMEEHDEESYEIVLVNDCSPDNVWKVIQERCKKDSHIVGVSLTKNFGQHSALMAGYHQAKGDIIISLDDDGQTPADHVYVLLNKLEEGYDVVYATYSEYHQTLFRRIGSVLAKKMTYYMLDVKEDLPSGSSYYAMRRFLRDEIIKYENPYPYLGGLVLRSTRNVAMVPIPHRSRLTGKSGYSLKKLVSLWLNGFTAFSVKPLELGSIIGVLLAVSGFLLALFIIIRRIINPTIHEGWSSLFSFMMVLSGVIMFMLGIIGEYIGRIYICINKSPQFIIKDIVSKDSIPEGWERRDI